MNAPPRWTQRQLAIAAERAIKLFRSERLEEPLEAYLNAFDEYQGNIEELLEATVDLTELEPRAAAELLAEGKLLQAFRYLAGPPISVDDLKTVAEAPSLNPKTLRRDLKLVRRIIEVVRSGLDRRRFPWISEKRTPTEDERLAAVIASAALMAAQRVGTARRSAGKQAQEARVEGALMAAGMKKAPSRRVDTISKGPNPGEFCGESLLGTRKADFLLGLWDRRLMPIECKVSNSATNSVKRLNNDAAAKAEAWRNDFGTRQVVPVAVLSGVYKLHNLEEAQDRGLTLFWAHDLESLLSWIEKTRET